MSSIAVGTEITPLRIDSVSAPAMHTMARILADPNLIHLDAEVVKRLGMGDRVINQGPSNCGYVMNMLRSAFPGWRLRRFEVRFLSNVRGGDAVEAGGRIVGVDDQGVDRSIICAVWLDVDGGPRALEGTAVLSGPPAS